MGNQWDDAPNQKWSYENPIHCFQFFVHNSNIEASDCVFPWFSWWIWGELPRDSSNRPPEINHGGEPIPTMAGFDHRNISKRSGNSPEMTRGMMAPWWLNGSMHVSSVQQPGSSPQQHFSIAAVGHSSSLGPIKTTWEVHRRLEDHARHEISVTSA